MLHVLFHLVNSWAISWEKSQLATAAQSTICVRIILSTSTEIICKRATTDGHHGEKRKKKHPSGLQQFKKISVVCTCGWFLHTSYTTFKMCSFPSSLSVRVFKISWNLEGSGEIALWACCTLRGFIPTYTSISLDRRCDSRQLYKPGWTASLTVRVQHHNYFCIFICVSKDQIKDMRIPGR